jgi:peptide/nickel transport system ATP-binding protein
MSGDPVLAFTNVNVLYPGNVWAVREIDLRVHARECVALVGESGCGKTTLARAALGLLPKGTKVMGSIRIGEIEVVGASRHVLRRLRGLVVGYVDQNPYAACDPLKRVEHHVAEAWRVHGFTPPTNAVTGSLARLGIPDPDQRARLYPHQWSGGMLQRATIAAADVHNPPLIIADEPTSALDADRAHSIIEALSSTGAALLLVSHDISIVERHADHVAVIYAGRIVEQGETSTILAKPRHPYTQALLGAIPQPDGGLPVPLAGNPPSLVEAQPGCLFADRCVFAFDRCRVETPLLGSGVACHLANP